MSQVEQDTKLQLHEIDEIVDEIEEKNMSQVDQEDAKDKRIMFEALGRIRKRRNTNTKKLIWKTLRDEYINDKKNENNKKEKEKRMSQLIDINNKQMCGKGHSYWCPWDTKEGKCIMCGSKKEIKFCDDCCVYEYANKGNYNTKASHFSYCSDCRYKNGKNISNRIKLNNFKAAIIREELLANPCLELDILCNMQRRAAVDSLIYDINQLQFLERGKWCLLVMDLDFLKCWNSCLGHVKTDGLIKKIGAVMSRNINDINNGKWIDKNNKWNSLSHGFVYRTGGDEFVIAIKCAGGDYGAAGCPFGPFYNKMKREINQLGKDENLRDLFGENEKKEWEEAKKALKNAKDRDGNPVDMSLVGISTGMYVPGYEVKESDWLSIADKIALEHSKLINKPMKNGVAIYCY